MFDIEHALSVEIGNEEPPLFNHCLILVMLNHYEDVHNQYRH